GSSSTPKMRGTPCNGCGLGVFQGRLTIPADGTVPGLEAADADRESLLEAGLVAQGVAYTELSFASADALPSGHYVLGLALGNERQLLIDAKAKLLVAYRAKKK
ncbi:hypothetical protein M3O39_17460, partial [Xanthomonas nasturtii]|nr:hypothetical protein [Xanthomonas nasturtii]MCL1535883.1 hypothetical protein [Xanthomonas nasturtii]MCL1545189.1 hypothetical protein [Xanthomonas nasturtii]